MGGKSLFIDITIGPFKEINLKKITDNFAEIEIFILETCMFREELLGVNLRERF